MSAVIDDVVGMCAYCDHRFRRVFKPTNLGDYTDEDGNPLADSINDIDVIVLDICLKSDVVMGNDITYECNHFIPKKKEEDDSKRLTLFKHLK